jgi:hypothetical protein
MSTRAQITTVQLSEPKVLFGKGDLVQYDAPENMTYIVMVTKEVKWGDDMFQGVAITSNGLNLIGDFDRQYITDQFSKFRGVVELTAD